MPLIVRQRSRLAVLAVLALVGSLLAVSAVPVVAAEAEAEASAEAEFSACVDAATEDAGYTDVIGDTQEAVNCLAHYGITKGRAGGIYEPRESIKRQQMALFMHRAAGPAGIEMDDTEDQGLTDIGDFSDEVQEAINQVAKLEIMGATIGDDTTFEPNGLVTRASMAVILDGFLTAAGVDLDEVAGVAKDDGTSRSTSRSPISAGSTPMRRLRSTGCTSSESPRATPTERSIPTGWFPAVRWRSSSRGRSLIPTPAQSVSQSQGKTEGETDTAHALTVSVRDEDHQPVADALVDVFSSSTRMMCLPMTVSAKTTTTSSLVIAPSMMMMMQRMGTATSKSRSTFPRSPAALRCGLGPVKRTTSSTSTRSTRLTTRPSGSMRPCLL